MTLADSYREVMEHITVTAELRGRVLRTVDVYKRQDRYRMPCFVCIYEMSVTHFLLGLSA